jgi:hypothetical protein
VGRGTKPTFLYGMVGFRFASTHPTWLKQKGLDQDKLKSKKAKKKIKPAAQEKKKRKKEKKGKKGKKD